MTICAKTHKSVRYEIRNVRFLKKQKSTIFPYGLRNDMNVSHHVIQLSQSYLPLQSLRAPPSFIFHF
ncbi:hypothetical protein DJ94_5051 [Bacillus pseudomycoides]|nr:hypothetical protein DJ94_5051 [Bacillus pseudomycoides]